MHETALQGYATGRRLSELEELSLAVSMSVALFSNKQPKRSSFIIGLVDRHRHGRSSAENNVVWFTFFRSKDFAVAIEFSMIGNVS